MEIIVLPFLAFSFLIAWAVFSPFSALDELDDWTFDEIQTCDMIAAFLPLSAGLATLTSTLNPTKHPAIFCTLLAAVVLFSSFTLFAGLFVLAKMTSTSSAKRMAIIGLIMPAGSFLCLAWIVVPVLAFTAYAWYAIPFTLIFVPIVFVIRKLSFWACNPGQDIA